MDAMHPTVTAQRIRLELELEPRSEGDPIAGVLRAGDGVARPFEGWLELTSALERARPPA